MKETSNNQKYREYIMSKVRAIVDANNRMAEPGTMYPGLFRTYEAVRHFVNPILKSMGISIDKNKMLTDKQFAVACGLVDRYANAAIYNYFQHTNWNSGWRTNFEIVKREGRKQVKRPTAGSIYNLKEEAKEKAFPMWSAC